MRAAAVLAVAAFSLGLAATAAPASAQSYGAPPPPPYQGQNTINQDAYCAQVRQNRTLIGGAVGATLGAVLGNNVAAHHHQADGSIFGGVLGGATGALIGRNTGQCSVAAQNRARAAAAYPNGGYQQGAYGGQPAPVDPGYRSPTSSDRYPLEGGNSGGGYNNAGYGAGDGDPNCRWGSISTRDPDGREVRDSVYMCRGPDGIWRPKQSY